MRPVLHDVAGGIFKRVELASTGQRHRIVERVFEPPPILPRIRFTLSGRTSFDPVVSSGPTCVAR